MKCYFSGPPQPPHHIKMVYICIHNMDVQVMLCTQQHACIHVYTFLMDVQSCCCGVQQVTSVLMMRQSCVSKIKLIITAVMGKIIEHCLHQTLPETLQ